MGVAKLVLAVRPVTLRFKPKTGHEETIQVIYLFIALLSLPLLQNFNVKRVDGFSLRIPIVNSEVSAWEKLNERNEVTTY